jgi:hypothetical protein
MGLLLQIREIYGGNYYKLGKFTKLIHCNMLSVINIAITKNQC